MKALLFITSLFLFSSTVFSCETPTRRKIGSIIHNLKSPTYWRTVKGSSFEANTRHPAFVTVLKQIDKSFVEYKGEVYRFDEQEVVICDRPKSNELRVMHPRANANIIRVGNGDEALLTIRSGFITMRLRPTHLVVESNIIDDSKEQESDLDLFEQMFTPVSLF